MILLNSLTNFSSGMNTQIREIVYLHIWIDYAIETHIPYTKKVNLNDAIIAFAESVTDPSAPRWISHTSWRHRISQ